MALKMIMETIFVFTLLLHSGVDGRKVSRQEDRELEKQLKLLNKPAVKTIKTEYRDIYDCVDFYKQPAFDHPLLKNHSYHFQMKPDPVLKGIEIDDDQKGHKPQHVELPRVKCPYGTVPIRRITKADLLREKLLLKRQASISKYPIKDDAGLYYRAGELSAKVYAGNIHGAISYLGLYNPRVLPPQFSSSLIDVHNDGDFIKVGWTVDNALYGDNLTRLFTYFKGGSTACYNTRCPGFILTQHERTLDMVFPNVTVPHGKLLEVKIVVQRNPGTGNWWLYLGNDGIEVGYWPNEIFTSLKGAASSVFYGADVFSPSNLPKPPMGNGHIPQYFLFASPYTNAFHRSISYIDSTNTIRPMEKTSSDCTDDMLYSVLWYDRGKGPYWLNSYLYGGPEV